MLVKLQAPQKNICNIDVLERCNMQIHVLDIQSASLVKDDHYIGLNAELLKLNEDIKKFKVEDGVNARFWYRYYAQVKSLKQFCQRC